MRTVFSLLSGWGWDTPILGLDYKEYLLGLVSNAPLGPMKNRTPCRDSRVKGRISGTSIMTNYDSD